MMLTVGYVSYRSTVKVDEAVELEKHTQDVLISLNETFASTVDIETGMRGYFLSGDDRYLKPYTEGKQNIDSQLQHLRALVNDNPTQLARMDVLEKLLKERIADADRKVEARRELGLDQALALFKTTDGMSTMDKIRGVVDDLKNAEVELLSQREADLKAWLNWSKWTLALSSAAGFLTLALAYAVVVFEVRKRKKAEEDLKDSNKGLESRVEKRTAELAAVNASLAESELFRRAVIDSLPAHIAVLDSAGTILLVNEAWERFARSNVSDNAQISATGVGQNYLAILDGVRNDKDVRVVRDNLEAILDKEKQSFKLEYDCHSDTEERWFLMQADALHGSSGGLVISHYNITDRVKAEQAVRLSEEFNRSIVENSPDCVKVLDLNGALLSMNYPGMCLMEIDDFSPFIGMEWSGTWSGEGSDQARQAVEKARNGNADFFEGFCPTARGTPKWWEVSVAPVLDELGKPHRILVVSREISGRKKAEDEREEILLSEKAARREAEIANRLRDEFMATVSHELRTPLNSILGWARLLKGGMLDEITSKKAVDTIIKSSENQNRLIEDLLDVARLISGKLELDIKRVNPVELVSNSIETVRPMADAKNISLNVEIDENSVETEIAGDVNRLQQIALNLMTNAIKFTPEGGRVDIGLSIIDGSLQLDVKDTGMGINPEFLPYVFERFRQDVSSVQRQGGLGLGLAIVRHLVELHGGSVVAHSDGKDLGSRFTVKFPLAG
jgi:PAS domain S-box-containing protein